MTFEPLQKVIDRVDLALEKRQDTVVPPFVATTITLRIDDVQRLVHAAIWGDDT
ncbi:hypothetical protein DEI97_013485 [Curtobacterium sp. MCLR17_032]|uniref:hypothetical protein n=1 Tax=Curtobacterium sp. MCLR17_032 TaxID=2175650 RepID=UPI0015E8A66E|nr:hypothetical protein [Curtobacterium sp. MCLR17_032]WIE60753.1 hypothetical protein DEI97_013485 [Curtobacterium sp. MCLR17_032]